MVPEGVRSAIESIVDTMLGAYTVKRVNLCCPRTKGNVNFNHVTMTKTQLIMTAYGTVDSAVNLTDTQRRSRVCTSVGPRSLLRPQQINPLLHVIDCTTLNELGWVESAFSKKREAASKDFGIGRRH